MALRAKGRVSGLGPATCLQHKSASGSRKVISLDGRWGGAEGLRICWSDRFAGRVKVLVDLVRPDGTVCGLGVTIDRIRGGVAVGTGAATLTAGLGAPSRVPRDVRRSARRLTWAAIRPSGLGLYGVL